MTWFELFLLAVSLCFDTFAVSVGGSQSMHKAPAMKIALIALTFAVFQGGLTFIGWLGGIMVLDLIRTIDHWIALAVLAYLGVSMLAEAVKSFRNGEESEGKINLLSTRVLLLSAVATSIDALAVGVSLAMIELGTVKAVGGVSIIAGVTFVSSVAGVLLGKWLGRHFQSWAKVVGGVILVSLGVKIFLEHTVLA